MNDSTSQLPIVLLTPEQLDELNTLVKPISEAAPCGQPMRFDPIFTEIRMAREEDDPNLPMGVWERPLKRADWSLIEVRCKTMLTHHSKDLQIAAWLMEAWTRQHGFDGLFRGLVLVERLVNAYWETLHPLLDDDGDADSRVAPLDWINESMAQTIKVQIPMLRRSAGLASKFSLADWERMTASELSTVKTDEAKKKTPEGVEPPPTRAEIIAYASNHLGEDVERSTQLVKGCSATVRAVNDFVDARLGMQAPNLTKLSSTLAAIERVLHQLAPAHRGPKMIEETASLAPDASSASSASPGVNRNAPGLSLDHWNNRDEAYATLEAIADYLSRVEPHSPTPYLLRRAVNWGRMPLPELMAEIVREEGDLNRLGNILGLNN